MIRIFIGFDTRETVAFHVLSNSILRHSSQPVAFTPLRLSNLQATFTRDLDKLASTQFSFSRFLVPSLCEYEGWSIFMDCDMLVQTDIAQLWNLRDDKYAVMCVKHNHVPKETTKFLNQTQTVYEKKNWSSVMLFNNAKCKALTPEYVNSATGLELHRFKWLENDDLIGEIPHGWNHLVDYDPNVPAEEVMNFHYTSGGPYFADYKNASYADEWFKELKLVIDPLPSA